MSSHSAEIPARPARIEQFIDQFLTAICDSSRRHILEYLTGSSENASPALERSVGEIAQHLGLALSTTSEHLKQLLHMHLLLARRDGKKTYYRLRNHELVSTFHALIASLEMHYHSNMLPPVIDD
ncbi:MAG TPA: metalloregulator ArsR/SmtB family transcription factor [Ktedonobacteraceae bacterium]|nr:metalloregulator ArsR/SmtB family transcription factor [Ktedonobacteraceae bacterium]